MKISPLSYSGFPENPLLVSRVTPRSIAVSGWEVEHHWLHRVELVHPNRNMRICWQRETHNDCTNSGLAGHRENEVGSLGTCGWRRTQAWAAVLREVQDIAAGSRWEAAARVAIRDTSRSACRPVHDQGHRLVPAKPFVDAGARPRPCAGRLLPFYEPSTPYGSL